MNISSSIVAILGTGVWGTALGTIVKSNHHELRFWSHRGTASLESIVRDAAIIVSAVSMKGVIATATKLRSLNISCDPQAASTRAHPMSQHRMRAPYDR